MTHHVHDWTLAENVDGPIGYLCTECTDRSPICGTCQRRPTGSELLICPRCLDHERQVLADIDHALSLYVAPAPSVLKAVRYDTDKVDGGGSDALPFGIDATADSTGEGVIRTPDGVLDVLATWAAAWADELGYVGVLGYPGDTPPSIEFLRQHLIWAAQTPDASGWDDYRTEARQLRHHARRIAGLLPARAAAPCVHCGGTVVQDWADRDWNPNRDGLSDTLRCTGCGTTWGDRDRWDGSVHRALRVVDQAHPDALITLEQARQIWPHIPAATFRSWLKRDRDAAELHAQRLAEHDAAVERGEESEPPWPYKRRLPEEGTTTDGTPLYRVGALATYVEWRVDIARTGRPATRPDTMAG